MQLGVAELMSESQVKTLYVNFPLTPQTLTILSFIELI
ncbi:hypothetical protein NIES4101_76170 [Calothrix sp. NIES-4101]|nr:hypothetical protein NIES4101_76170 [Calothrix sp. NIES-4101]